jgi:hypothetical protein
MLFNWDRKQFFKYLIKMLTMIIKTGFGRIFGVLSA